MAENFVMNFSNIDLNKIAMFKKYLTENLFPTLL